MKRSFKLENLDCAHCAAKMEKAIGALPNVTSAVISFMSARLTIEADESAFPAVIDDAQKAIKGIEKDCLIVR